MTLPSKEPVARPKILLLHLSPSGQFMFFGRWLARNGWDVTTGYRGDGPETMQDGIRNVSFRTRDTTIAKSDFRHILDYAAQNALGTTEMLLRLREEEGYHPDVVMAHVGWGVGLCVKQVWPEARYVAFHEWYYADRDWSKGGKAERPENLASIVGNRMRNLPIAAEFDTADANWCPTQYQASRFPPVLRQQMQVISDGVDCDIHVPDPEAKVDFDWLNLPEQTHILTYATRGMEPLRGFPQFMKSVELLQKRRSDFHTIVLANDSVSYGAKLPEGDSWRLRMLDKLELDHRRLHIFDARPRDEYLRVLQASTAHVYFTEPFVTSWSLSEALACGALVIGSNTGPVMELIEDLDTGILVDMDDPEEIADMVEWAFDHPVQAGEVRARARAQMLRDHNAAQVFAMKDTLLRRMIDR